MRFTGWVRFAVATSAVALVAMPAMADKELEFFGFDPAEYSPAGKEGLAEIYSGRMFHTALPVSLVEAMAADEAKSLPDDLGYDPDSPEGKFFAAGTLPAPPSQNVGPEIALGQTLFERDGAAVTNFNCFACHAGVVNGKIVAGLGNANIMQRPPAAKDGSGPNMFKLASALKTDAEKKILQDLMKNGGGLSPVVPEMTNRGDNYGPFAVWAYGASLADPENTGMLASKEETELSKLIEETLSPPVNAMPWWLMKYKEKDYWYGDGAPDDAAHFSMNFSGSYAEVNEDHPRHVESTGKALAFARETVSPVYPGRLDADLVKKGADIFHGRVEPQDASTYKECFKCHGTYTKKLADADYSQPGGWDVRYDGSTKLKNVKTDPAYNEVTQKYLPISEHISKLQTYFDKEGAAELAPSYDQLVGKGYVPPPLVGVWASAPYFHNGAVPTVEAVLNSKLRPEIWSWEGDAFAYDLDRMGVEFEAISRAEYDGAVAKAAEAHHKSATALAPMFMYDTEGFGRGNMGHMYGDSMTSEEREAVMEFLKSLSGRDM